VYEYWGLCVKIDTKLYEKNEKCVENKRRER